MTKRENLQWEQKKLSKNALQSRKNGTSFLKKKKNLLLPFFSSSDNSESVFRCTKD